MTWEVDWTRTESGYRGKFWARNLTSHIQRSRDWHWVSGGHLRVSGISTPTYRKDSWEVDWSKRRGKDVWARNPSSKMPEAREWHWTTYLTLQVAGVKWRPAREGIGRWIGSDGYVLLNSRGMTDEEIKLADEHGLWRRNTTKVRTSVHEHRLVAVRKFGAIPKGIFVRHLDGDKTNNHPDNLVLGTPKENVADHETARKMAMYWHNKYDEAQREIERLERVLHAIWAKGTSGRSA